MGLSGMGMGSCGTEALMAFFVITELLSIQVHCDINLPCCRIPFLCSHMYPNVPTSLLLN